MSEYNQLNEQPLNSELNIELPLDFNQHGGIFNDYDNKHMLFNELSAEAESQQKVGCMSDFDQLVRIASNSKGYVGGSNVLNLISSLYG